MLTRLRMTLVGERMNGVSLVVMSFAKSPYASFLDKACRVDDFVDVGDST